MIQMNYRRLQKDVSSLIISTISSECFILKTHFTNLDKSMLVAASLVICWIILWNLCCGNLIYKLESVKFSHVAKLKFCVCRSIWEMYAGDDDLAIDGSAILRESVGKLCSYLETSWDLYWWRSQSDWEVCFGFQRRNIPTRLVYHFHSITQRVFRG